MTYQHPATTAGLRWFARFGIEHQDSVYARPIHGAYNGARSLLNARVGVALGAWSLDFWGSNLANTNYIRAVASRGPAFFPTTPRPQDMLFGDGRRIGAELHLKF